MNGSKAVPGLLLTPSLPGTVKQTPAPKGGLMHSTPPPSWPPLTVALDDPNNGARALVDRLLTGGDLRGVQREYRSSLAPLQVDTRAANPGTVGTAVDMALRFHIDPEPDLGLPARGAAVCGPVAFGLLTELMNQFGGRLDPLSLSDTAASAVKAPLSGPEHEVADLARTCWVLALFVEVYRAGLLPGSPLIDYLKRRRPTAEGLLAVASVDAIAEVADLITLAQEQLLIPLASAPQPWHVGPRFAGSQWMKADADFIAGGALVEVKTNLGDKNPRGVRAASLKMESVRQVLGYVLHDYDDVYRIDEIGVYQARYGTLTRWPLQALLDRLAGRSVDLATERRLWQQLLQRG